MPNIGFNELLVILLLAVLLFGGSKLPGLGKSLGEGIKNFKKGMKGEDEEAKGPGEATPPPSAPFAQPGQIARQQPNPALGQRSTLRDQKQDEVVDVDHRDIQR